MTITPIVSTSPATIEAVAQPKLAISRPVQLIATRVFHPQSPTMQSDQPTACAFKSPILVQRSPDSTGIPSFLKTPKGRGSFGSPAGSTPLRSPIGLFESIEERMKAL